MRFTMLIYPKSPARSTSAAIAAWHATASRAEEADWVRIAALYEALARLSPSPVVERSTKTRSPTITYSPASARTF